MKTLLITLTLATMVGCTQTGPRPTHVWSSPDRELRRNFVLRNSSCAASARQIKEYEFCMKQAGYKLKLASR